MQKLFAVLGCLTLSVVLVTGCDKGKTDAKKPAGTPAAVDTTKAKEAPAADKGKDKPAETPAEKGKDK